MLNVVLDRVEIDQDQTKMKVRRRWMQGKVRRRMDE